MKILEIWNLVSLKSVLISLLLSKNGDNWHKLECLQYSKYDQMFCSFCIKNWINQNIKYMSQTSLDASILSASSSPKVKCDQL